MMPAVMPAEERADADEPRHRRAARLVTRYQWMTGKRNRKGQGARKATCRPGRGEWFLFCIGFDWETGALPSTSSDPPVEEPRRLRPQHGKRQARGLDLGYRGAVDTFAGRRRWPVVVPPRQETWGTADNDQQGPGCCSRAKGSWPATLASFRLVRPRWGLALEASLQKGLFHAPHFLLNVHLFACIATALLDVALPPGHYLFTAIHKPLHHNSRFLASTKHLFPLLLVALQRTMPQLHHRPLSANRRKGGAAPKITSPVAALAALVSLQLRCFRLLLKQTHGTL